MFNSRTYGKVSFATLVNIMEKYINAEPEYKYKITVGTDSQGFNDHTKVVVVIAVTRIGKGGIFFYKIKNVPKITNLKQKIFYEVGRSLEIADRLNIILAEKEMFEDVEIHIDVGKNGPTSSIISDVTGWVTSCGYYCKIKPYSSTAFCIANRISK